ncbi:tetratricopeptide repeat domain protein [Leadbettera azotonutricia ZAS-9]|uniref:Tetratricopeptide repeat domain protein n=1 Tax=Leadbettera azotonutricia (strain ATCC BAA-888 / DSM 13862 / ZAS-9) TaxID=545695 RepID=F5Y7S2_LEAAZ|nr:tetratricopeptide repeat domain protein [Leadbettera azotonutricia ZAS-9]
MSGNPLKPVGLAGLILALVFAWALLFYSVIRDKGVYPENAQQSGSTFSRDLARCDAAFLQESPEALDRMLSRLEKRAKGQEERLSLLKRRRDLARRNIRRDPRWLAGYEKSARDAATAFPYSEPIAAIAIEAILLANDHPAGEALALLKTLSGRVTQPRFDTLVLSLLALGGDLESPAKAIAVPGIGALLGLDLPGLPAPVTQDLLVDKALLDILRGEAAGTRLANLIRENPEDRRLLRMGAEYFYDYGNPLRAAELFARLGDDESLIREADALALAGLDSIPAARNIWTALGASAGTSPGAGQASAAKSRAIQSRSLYNLAATSPTEREAAAWLEKFFTARSMGNIENPGPRESFYDPYDSAGIYGIIRYTRLQDTARSIAILEDETLASSPLLDLELLRRRLETLPNNRSAAEVWLLLGRHPGDGDLYQWGAYWFDRQKLYTETAQLLKIASNNFISAPWMDLHQGLSYLRQEKTGEAEKLFKEALAKGSRDWRVSANLARIQEGRRSIAAALESYENAAALAPDLKDVSRLQVRISRCLEALGQKEDGRRALEKALELDPDNITARHELRRMEIY